MPNSYGHFHIKLFKCFMQLVILSGEKSHFSKLNTAKSESCVEQSCTFIGAFDGILERN